MPTLYKILPAPLWREAEREGRFRGSEVDLRDGFIHFSTAEQVEEAAHKHFAGQDDLLLVRIEGGQTRRRAELGAVARRRAIPGYGDLDLAAVTKVEPLPLGQTDGCHGGR